MSATDDALAIVNLIITLILLPAILIIVGTLTTGNRELYYLAWNVVLITVGIIVMVMAVGASLE